MEKRFRISSALKDIIGRDLITNDFVAIFELVKNAFDAHATRVDIEFDEDAIIIVDDGKGMSEADITEKWLFVAYSAKRTGEEDKDLPRDYRDAIAERRGYAGNKGIGRFSCDRLGQALDLYSRPLETKAVAHLKVNWTDFEANSREEFGTVGVDLGSGAFPALRRAKPPEDHGTVLVIGDLRAKWDRAKIGQLRAYLAKLVDPFETTADTKIVTYVAHASWPEVEGPVGNQIIDLLDEKTARISVKTDGKVIQTSLHDRGALIYRIEEDVKSDSQYADLIGSDTSCTIYYLNRSAKHTFTYRMGVRNIDFGHIFLFVNGFRIYPLGEPTDDTLGIGRRKQQGSARYLGLRDVIGKVDVSAPPGMFVEATSRDAGLTDTSASAALYEVIMRHGFLRLERYVTSVNWVDKLDQDVDDSSGLRSDAARSRIIKIVQSMAGSKNIRLVDYDREIIDIVNERSSEFEDSLEGLTVVAERMGDESLLSRIERSRERFEELRQAEADARKRADEEAEARREAERRAREAEERAAQAGAKLERVEKQAQLLLNAQTQGSDELQLLHHQVIIYATEVQALAKRSMRRLAAADFAAEAVLDDLEQIAFQNSRILAVTRLATQASFKLDADKLTADLIQYMKEYVEKVSTIYGDVGSVSFKDNGIALQRTFRPVDVAIVLDNLFSNAGKAGAGAISFECRKASTGGTVQIVVSDNGHGVDDRTIDESKLFERGYSGSPRGSGLGLYHVKQVLEQMGGGIGLDPDRRAGKAQFLINLPGEKKNEA